MKSPTPKMNDPAEHRRLTELSAHERGLADMGYRLIAGCDEVGRGSVAGPVAACMMILPVGFVYPGINDSKKLSAKKRDLLNGVLIENAVSYAVAFIDETVIDEINILEATRRAMENAYHALEIKPDYLLVDAMELSIPVMTKSLIGGDGLSISIAAASIVAKVCRDNVMNRLHEKYPMYGFDKNKGYGTKAHMEAIKRFGPCPAHRRTFIGKVFSP